MTSGNLKQEYAKRTMRSQILFRNITRDLEEIRHEVHSAVRIFDGVIKDLVDRNPVSTVDAVTLFLHTILERLTEIEKEITGYSSDLHATWNKVFISDAEDLYSAYTDDRIQSYRRIDDKLHAIEEAVKRNFERISKYCQLMVDGGYIEDYAIHIELSFILDENDPEYMDDDDNILATLIFQGKIGCEMIDMLEDGMNDNVFQNQDHPLRNEHYCHLFRCLYEQTDLSWDEILKIGMTWVDINVTYQRSCKINEKPENRLESCGIRATSSLGGVRSKICAGIRTLEVVAEKMFSSVEAADTKQVADSIRDMIESLRHMDAEIKQYRHDMVHVLRGARDDDPSDRFSPDRIQIYRKMNESLQGIETEILNDFRGMTRHCQSMMDDGSIEDYEVDAEVSFSTDAFGTDANGAVSTVEGDGILATFNGKADLSEDSALDSGTNFNEYTNLDSHPLRGEHHCWLFHSLYDHTGLNWDQLLEVNSVRVNIKTQYQNFYRLRFHPLTV